MFFGLELYNQYLWFNNRKVSYNNIESSKESFEALRSEKVNITGLKLMFESLILGEGRINNKFGIYPSFVSGIGFLYQTYKFESSNGTWRGQPIVVVKKESGHLFLPSFHLGIKLNFYVNYK